MRTDPAEWITAEMAVVHSKLSALTEGEKNEILVPGSRTINELLAHLNETSGGNFPLHTAYHLGEISLLAKVALARRPITR